MLQAFNGKYKFVIFRKTGHVLSERALKEVRRLVLPSTFTVPVRFGHVHDTWHGRLHHALCTMPPILADRCLLHFACLLSWSLPQVPAMVEELARSAADCHQSPLFLPPSRCAAGAGSG